MPLVRIDAVEGHSETEIQTLLHAAHRAMLGAFGVLPRDRYQIATEHPRSHMVIEDTGLGIERSDRLVVVQVITRRILQLISIKAFDGFRHSVSSWTFIPKD